MKLFHLQIAKSGVGRCFDGPQSLDAVAPVLRRADLRILHLRERQILDGKAIDRRRARINAGLPNRSNRIVMVPSLLLLLGR